MHCHCLAGVPVRPLPAAQRPLARRRSTPTRAAAKPPNGDCASSGDAASSSNSSSSSSSSGRATASASGGGITRRQLAALAAAAAAAGTAFAPPLAAAALPTALPVFTPGSLRPPPGGSGAPSKQPPTAPDLSCARLDPEIGAAFTKAVAEALGELGVAPEEELQKERFKLFNQEYSYYAEANRDKLPALPDLSDDSGGLSNRTYWNFVSYIGWKTAARRVQSPQGRTALCARAGELLLPAVAPGAAEALRREARGGAASEAAVAAAIQSLLARLQSVGYACAWQLTWDEQPGGWPPDWFTKEPGFVGQLPGAAPGTSDPGSDDGRQITFQIKMLQPADIQASVALRSEDDGFWGRHVSSMLTALLAAGGWAPADLSEFFYQDDWSGPKDVGSKLLLAFGDPLQAVDIPWTPTTLVQDWVLRPAARA